MIIQLHQGTVFVSSVDPILDSINPLERRAVNLVFRRNRRLEFHPPGTPQRFPKNRLAGYRSAIESEDANRGDPKSTEYSFRPGVRLVFTPHDFPILMIGYSQ